MIGESSDIFSSCVLTACRLSDISSHHSSGVSPSRVITNPLERTYGRAVKYLASDSNEHSRNAPRRRMALSSYAQISPAQPWETIVPSISLLSGFVTR